jgi:AcrR family transcriptional regulator
VRWTGVGWSGRAYDAGVSKPIEATLAGHRSRQRAAILEAARDLLLEGGFEALTFAALAARTGLARPSLYGYFPSRDEVAVAVCEQVLPRWLAGVQAAMDAVPDPRRKVAAYLRTQWELADSGEHRLAAVLREAPLNADARARLRAVHEQFGPRVSEVLGDLGVRRPELAAALVQGVATAGVRLLEQGVALPSVAEDGTALALAGLDRLAGRD